MKSCVWCSNEVATISDTPVCSKSCLKQFAHDTWCNIDGEFRCHICFRPFDSSQALIAHVNSTAAYHSEASLSKQDIPALAHICEWCGEKFYPRNRTHNVNRFCSKVCEGMARRTDETDPRRKQEYIEWAKKKRSESGECEDCGEEETLHVHHIVPVSERPDMCMDESNVVVVCNMCHAERHNDDPNVSAMLRSL